MAPLEHEDTAVTLNTANDYGKRRDEEAAQTDSVSTTSMDKGLYNSEVILADMAANLQAEETQQVLAESTITVGAGGLQSSFEEGLTPSSPSDTPVSPYPNLQPLPSVSEDSLPPTPPSNTPGVDVYPNDALSSPRSFPLGKSLELSGRCTHPLQRLSDATTDTNYEVKLRWERVGNILNRCLQPPVIGALGGIFVL